MYMCFPTNSECNSFAIDVVDAKSYNNITCGDLVMQSSVGRSGKVNLCIGFKPHRWDDMVRNLLNNTINQ